MEEKDVTFLSPGQATIVLFPESGARPLEGTIKKVSAEPSKEIPKELLATGQIAFPEGHSGPANPVDHRFAVVVALREIPTQLKLQQTGTGKIHLAGETLATRLSRWLRQTFLLASHSLPHFKSNGTG